MSKTPLTSHVFDKLFIMIFYNKQKLAKEWSKKLHFRISKQRKEQCQGNFRVRNGHKMGLLMKKCFLVVKYYMRIAKKDSMKSYCSIGSASWTACPEMSFHDQNFITCSHFFIVVTMLNIHESVDLAMIQGKNLEKFQ